MAADGRRSSSAAPGGQSSSSHPASQPILEQNVITIERLETIEAWYKNQQRQVAKISDRLRLELKEARRRRQEEDGNDEEQYGGGQQDEAYLSGADAATAVQESMHSIREQLAVRRQRVEAINDLIRRRSELLEGIGCGVREAGDGSAEEKVESAKRWILESASYLPVLLRAMERRLILRSEVESLEPPAIEGAVCIRQRPAAAPVRQEESAAEIPTDGRTVEEKQHLASKGAVYVRPLAVAAPVPQEETEIKIAKPQSSVTTTKVQETEDLGSSYESFFSFLPEQNRRTVVNLEEIEAWYTDERLLVGEIQRSLSSMLQSAKTQGEQESSDGKPQHPQEESVPGIPSPARASKEQHLAKCLEEILKQQMALREEWEFIDELLRDRSEARTIQESSNQDGGADTGMREGDERAACIQLWMEEITSYFQVLICAILRRCLLKAEVESLEPPVDDGGACCRHEGSGPPGEKAE